MKTTISKLENRHVEYFSRKKLRPKSRSSDLRGRDRKTASSRPA
jgi:hypothetical protein